MLQSGEGEDAKRVVVFREFEYFDWLYHFLTTHNNVDGVVVSISFEIIVINQHSGDPHSAKWMVLKLSKTKGL